MFAVTAVFALTSIALPFASIVSASQTPISSDAPWGVPNFQAQARYLMSPGTLTFPSGLTVSIAENGSGLVTRQEKTCGSVSSMSNWYSNSQPWTTSPWTPSLPKGDVNGASFAEQPVFYTEAWTGLDSSSSGVWNCIPPAPARWQYTPQPACPITAPRVTEMRCPRGTITFTFNSPVTDPVLHVNNFGAAAWYPVIIGSQILTLDLANSNYSGAPGLELVSKIGNLAVVQDGANYQLPAGDSRFNGAPAITRTQDSPTIIPSWVGGGYGAGSIAFKGTWTTISMKLDLLWMYDSWHSKYNPDWAHEDVNYAKKSCMYDQMPNSPVYECDLQNGVWVPGTTFEKHADIINGLQDWMGAPEGVAYLWTVNDDFGTAPASYDGTDGASHVLSDLRIGASVSSTGGELADANGKVNNSGTSGIVSPNAGGTDAGDDAFVSVPVIPTSGDYSVSVPVTGVTQNAKLCGWIDVDASGSFDTVERQCVDVASNSTSAVLVWPESLVGSISGNTYMRLRLSYDLVGVESPNGRVASGEVEDWRVGRVSAASNNSSANTPQNSGASTSGSQSSSKSKNSNTTNELPKTGGSVGMTPAGFVGIVCGAIILTIRRRQLR